MPFAWRGHTKRLTTRARPSPDLAVWLEYRRPVGTARTTARHWRRWRCGSKSGPSGTTTIRAMLQGNTLNPLLILQGNTPQIRQSRVSFGYPPGMPRRTHPLGQLLTVVMTKLLSMTMTSHPRLKNNPSDGFLCLPGNIPRGYPEYLVPF